MSKKLILTLLSAIVIALLYYLFKPQQPEEESSTPSSAEQAVIERVSNPDFGDLEDIKERRLLRVLVQYSKTNFSLTGRNSKVLILK